MRSPTSTYAFEDGDPDKEVALLEPGKKRSIDFTGDGRGGIRKYELVYSHVEDAHLDKSAEEYWDAIAEYMRLCYRKRFTVRSQSVARDRPTVDRITPDGSKVVHFGDRHARILRNNLLKDRVGRVKSGRDPLQPPSSQARPNLFYQPQER